MSLICFSFNPQGVNKDFDKWKLTNGFQDTQEPLSGLISHVKAGHAINCAQFRGRRRCAENVIGIQMAGLDFDNTELAADGTKQHRPTLTLEQAITHPFIARYACLLYTTASHTEQWHRLRVLFQFQQFLTDEFYYRDLITGLHWGLERLKPDRACKDPCRVFFGNTRAQFPLVRSSAVLPLHWCDAVVYRVQCERDRRQKQVQSNLKRFRNNLDQLIQEALSYIPPRSPGSGNYWESLQVLMALHSHYGEAAEDFAESWSPSIPGSTWRIGYKLRSFRRGNGIAIGTLFWIAQRHGWQAPWKTGGGA